uniref:Ovule protein n=1 Tax=Angiostrongylus cantonensis TaxID=6313 RepID=A0A0K0CSY0_ANGCA
MAKQSKLRNSLMKRTKCSKKCTRMSSNSLNILGLIHVLVPHHGCRCGNRMISAIKLRPPCFHHRHRSLTPSPSPLKNF